MRSELHTGKAERADEAKPRLGSARIGRAAADVVAGHSRERRIVDPRHQVADAEHPQCFGHGRFNAPAGHSPSLYPEIGGTLASGYWRRKISAHALVLPRRRN